MNIPVDVLEKIPKAPEDIKIEQRIEKFKNMLKDDRIEIGAIIDRYLLFGTPYFFEDDEDKYFELKSDIASFLHVKHTQVYIVGSGKLGFSIAPDKRYKHFNDESDIDVAVIDSELFLLYWRKLFEYSKNHELTARSENEERDFIKFKDYFFKGWLRPDKFPMKYRQEWFDFFNKMTSKYDRHITAGIYRDFDFFTKYHWNNLCTVRKELLEDVS